MNAKQLKRLLSLLMAFTLVIGLVVPVAAVGTHDSAIDLKFTETDNAPVPERPAIEVTEPETPAPLYEDTDEVRVSIFLDQASTLDAGFSTLGLAENDSATSYREQLLAAQEMIQEDIEEVTGSDLEVFWNLTLAANAISANVSYGDIESIEEVYGVDKVVIETRYEPQSVAAEGQLEPNMAVSSQMTGTNIAWKAGYSGAGSRIAIIDTGIDPQHQSVDNDAFLYALEQNAIASGMSYEDYVASLDLLDEAEIAEKLDQLNMVEAWNANPDNTEPLTADKLFLSEKLPLGFCYVDQNLGITHEQDPNSEHGSHVSGIAAANRFIEQPDGSFADAAETVGLVGNAPDAQILVMKVFGVNGGAYDSDYLAAIEDAIILGCDSVNLSLGSAMPGMAVYPEGYGEVLETMKDSDTVVCISMGNSGAWNETVNNIPHLTYVDHMNYYTGGSPGSYASPLTVGSVDNDGIVGYCFRVADHPYAFTETPVTTPDALRRPFMSLDTSEDSSGTSYGYVFLDSMGNPADFEGIDAAGKIVFIPRGEIAFTEKAANAVKAGAAAVIIYNNAPGVLNMNLDAYAGEQPVVSILQTDADLIRADSVAAQTAAGQTYYTGEFRIDHTITPVYYDSDFLNMSVFSSWGTPGDLSLKPEIVAPGGNIYSMNGTHLNPDGSMAGGHSSYELMSGTSMAAPQMSGISALVIQAIEDRDISVDSLTNRALAQSIMMSTARPMVNADGAYYPLIQQGAGVVDTAAAVGADSYVLVKGQDDGKAKAELGDDPARTGSYTFTFTLNNLDHTARTYNLTADVFGPEPVVYYANQNTEEDLAAFCGSSTIPLMASAVFTANGKPIVSADETLAGCDFNGDGLVNLADGQTLMNYTTGIETELYNEENADLSADGKITTYDVHQFLVRLNTATGVEVPADGSVEITATVSLTEEMKQQLDGFFTAGNYVYAYIHAVPNATAEGQTGTAHSIPMLAYYGSWSDNSLFDVGTYQEYTTGAEIRDPYFGNQGINSFAVTYGDQPDNAFYFGGNPVLPDSVYMPERNAINTERGDMISQLILSPIRNGADSRFLVMSGDEVLQNIELGSVPGAFYYWNNGSWQNTVLTPRLDWVPAEAGLTEGDEFRLVFEMATEYYLNDDLSVRWDELGDGCRIECAGVVDNTSPLVSNIQLDPEAGTLTVTASDNQYVSAVLLSNASGSEALAAVGAAADAEAGETRDFVLNLADVNGKKFLLQVADYAANITTYELEMQIGEELPVPEMMVFDLESDSWITDDYYCASGEYDSGLYRVLAELDRSMTAAAAVGDKVYSVSDDNQLFIAPLDEMNAVTYVAQLPYAILDMTYNRADKTLCAVNEENDLVTIDPMTGECTVLARIGVPTDALACDDAGVFYCTTADLTEGAEALVACRFTPETAAEPEEILRSSLGALPSELTESMDWNPNDGLLYWYGCCMDASGASGFLFRADPANAEATAEGFPQSGIRTGCIIITDENADSGESDDAQVEDVQLSVNETTIHRGLEMQIDAAVRPWNVADRSVSWSSSDESVATVDENGVVTAIQVGTAVITAASNQDPSKTASCTVTVDTVDVTLKGVLKNADGAHQMFRWNLDETESWVGGAAVDADVSSVAYDGAGKLYINDAIDDTGVIQVLNEATGALLETIPSETGAPLWDMTYAGYDNDPHLAGVWRWMMFLPGDPTPTMYFDLSDTTAPLFGMAYRGVDDVVDLDNKPQTALHLTLLDGNCDIIDFWVYQDGGIRGLMNITPSDLDVRFQTYEGVNKRSSLVTDQQGNLFLSYFNADTQQNDIYVLTFDEASESYHSELLAHMGKNIWPAALYEVVSGSGFASADAIRPSADACHVDAQSVTDESFASLVEEMSGRYFETPVEEEDTDPVGGSLNSVIPTAPEAKDEDIVTVTVSADCATTNGLITVDYDPQQLRLLDAGSRADLSAQLTGEQSVRVGYANERAVAEGSELVTLRFERLSDEETSLTVTVVEENDQEPNRSEVLVIPAKSTEPEPTEPETTEPETSEPETSEPEASEPETTEKPQKPGETPDTGDHSRILLWSALCLISLCGAVLVLLKTRKASNR